MTPKELEKLTQDLVNGQEKVYRPSNASPTPLPGPRSRLR